MPVWASVLQKETAPKSLCVQKQTKKWESKKENRESKQLLANGQGYTGFTRTMTDHSHRFLTKSYDNKWFCKNKNIFFYLISVKLLGPLAYFRINFSRKRLKVVYLVFKLSNATEAICRFFL